MNITEQQLIHATGCPAGQCAARAMRECYDAADHTNKNLMERLRNG